MKKFIALLAFVLVGTSMMYAQDTRKEQREAQRAQARAQEQIGRAHV